MRKNIKTVHAAFANAKSKKNQTALDALRDRVEHYDEIARSNGVRPSRISWLDIFRPEADMPKYRIDLEDTNNLETRAQSDIFMFSQDYDWKYCITVEGNPDEITELCQRICNLLSLACSVVIDHNEFLSVQETLKPKRGIKAVPYETVLYETPQTA